MIELIPAIDIIGGHCVRLTRGDYATQKTYDSDPVAVARRFEELGFRRLHVVDLDGARSRHIVNQRVLSDIAAATQLTIDFGGGIKSDDDIAAAFDAGAHMVTVGSIAVAEPERFESWLQRYGAEKIILGADARDGYISINGWEEASSQRLQDFIGHYMGLGVRNVLCTDISRDGMLAGPSTALYSEVMAAFPDCHLIASGGVSNGDDIRALDAAGIPAVVFGKAFYEGRIDAPALLSEFPQLP